MNKHNKKNEVEKRKQRKLEKQKEELQKLIQKRKELDDKLSRVKKDNLTTIFKKSKKIFASTCNFLIPYALTASITIGGVAIFGGGLPFYKDDIKKLKRYDLNYDNKTSIEMTSKYLTLINNSSMPTNSLIISFPYEMQSDGYIKVIRDYDISKENNKELIYAILDNNYDYINEKLTKYKEQIVKTNYIDKSENSYNINASIHFYDSKDILTYEESDLKNNIITLCEIASTLGIGSFCAYIREFEYFITIKRINNTYKIISIKDLKEEIKNTDSQILSLKKKVKKHE